MHLPARTFLSALVLLALVGATPPANLDRAIEAQLEILEQDPTNAPALNDLGNLMLLQNRTESAEQAYVRALTYDPGLVSARFNLGLLMLERGAEADALAEFTAITESHPEHAWAYFEIGVIREAMGHEKKAVDAYARAFALDPKLTFADENPQIIDSRLVTRALLEVGRSRPRGAEARRSYEESDRITRLLLPTLPDDDAESSSEPRASDGPTSMGGGSGLNGGSGLSRSESPAGTTDQQATGVEGQERKEGIVLDSSSLSASSSASGFAGGGRGATGSSTSSRSSASNTGGSRVSSGRVSTGSRATTGSPTSTSSSSPRPSRVRTASSGRNSSRIDG